MRILHVDSERPWRGGQNQILLLMRRQRARGDEPRLAAPPDSGLYARARIEAFPVHAVAMRGTWDLGSVLALAKLGRSLRPDLVHWHAARAHALGAMASLLAPAPARVLSRRVEFPVRRSPGSRLLYSIPIDRVIAISDRVKRAMVESGVDAAIVDVVPSGVEAPPPIDSEVRRTTRSSLGCSEEDVVVLTAAALAEKKGHEDLLLAAREASARAPRLRFWLAGEGPLRGRLEGRSRSLGLEDRVQFLGFRADIPTLLQSSDLFCLPSASEGLGSSILEAMAAGLPVIATRAGGIPEIVETPDLGLLVDVGDVGSLAGALAQLAGDRVLGEKMRVAVRARAARFTPDRTAEGTHRSYGAALDAARSRMVESRKS